MEKAVLFGGMGFYLIVLLLFASVPGFLFRFRLARIYRKRLARRITKFIVVLLFGPLFVFLSTNSFAYSSVGDEAKCVLWGITNGKKYEVNYVDDLMTRVRKSESSNPSYYLDILGKYLEFGRPRIIIDPFGSIGEWPPSNCD